MGIGKCWVGCAQQCRRLNVLHCQLDSQEKNAHLKYVPLGAVSGILRFIWNVLPRPILRHNPWL